MPAQSIAQSNEGAGGDSNQRSNDERCGDDGDPYAMDLTSEAPFDERRDLVRVLAELLFTDPAQPRVRGEQEEVGRAERHRLTHEA